MTLVYKSHTAVVLRRDAILCSLGALSWETIKNDVERTLGDAPALSLNAPIELRRTKHQQPHKNVCFGLRVFGVR